MIMRNLAIVALGVALAGCSTNRTEVDQDPRAKMVGMQQDQVIACLGAPARRTLEGAGEVWNYSSDNRMIPTNANTDVNSSRFSSRICNINIVFTNGKVSAVNYTGPTGTAPVTSDQCANAISPCAKQR